MLGSSRTIVQDGATAPCYDADFYPFGGERVIANTCPQNYKFEGKERDAETGNDDFGARYYSSRFGRWLSADWSAVPAPVPYANLTNPQTLNLYAMVSDNPETFADLDGHAGQGQANEGSDTNTGCNSASNKCNDDQSNHDQNAATSQQQTAAAGAAVITADQAAAGGAAGALVNVIVDVSTALRGLSVVGAVVDFLVNPPATALPSSDMTRGLDNSPINKEGSGPKAADAPGVTAGGQATDRYGNKLGPSGDTQVDKTRSNTREDARNRALGGGSGAVEHKRDKNMGPHFHPADKKGSKIPSSTHHEYPE